MKLRSINLTTFPILLALIHNRSNGVDVQQKGVNNGKPYNIGPVGQISKTRWNSMSKVHPYKLPEKVNNTAIFEGVVQKAEKPTIPEPQEIIAKSQPKAKAKPALSTKKVKVSTPKAKKTVIKKLVKPLKAKAKPKITKKANK